nr:hypothetical protein BaRGS_021826 [Batillaria attramentaria]
MNACRKKPAAPLHPIPVPKKKWSLVGMDIIGPLQVTDRGNQYIVALTDHFTKFPVAKAIPCKSSEEVARFMYETICIFGAFDSLITDQGREFINFALDILTDRFNINHRISSAYHPETNGQRERDNRTLKDTLVKITDNDDWDELLPAALFAYRTSVHKSTQFSPFLALYGEQAKLPFDVTGDANEQDLNEEIMDTMKGIHEEVKNKIGENISRAQKKQKEYYDSRRAYDHGFRIGDKVLIINAARVHRMGGKMAPRFVGPYEVISVLPKGRLQLKNTKRENRDVTKVKKRQLRKTAAKYTIREDVLYHDGILVAKRNQVPEILQEFHDNYVSGGHLGMNKTYKKVLERYFWHGMKQEVEDYCRSCCVCQNMNACRKKPAAPLHPIPVPKKKWSLVGMDIIGPLQVTDRGNQYIVALTDHFTKFPVAKAIPCKSSEEVARFMYETICIFGAFDSLITDQGREFINFALDILTDRFNINHRISSAYHPETNGQRERDNRTLKDTLVKITDNDDWDELLPAALFAYRTSVHKSTQFSPFLALYGEQAKLPFDVTGDANEQDLNEEIMDTMKGIHEEVKNKIGENISRAQKKQKEYYDSRRAYDHGFRIGDKVLIINAARVHRMGGKMAPRFVGPYEVISVLPKGRLQLKNTKRENRDVTKVKKRQLRKTAAKYTIREDVLYHDGILVAKRNQVPEILQEFHDNYVSGGHLGMNKTYKKVLERYFWHGMKQEVEDYCRSCCVCQNMNACRKKPAAPLHPIPVPKKKWSLVGMDIIGPLQVTDRGNQYIVALTDHFTKFPVAKAIPCKSSEEVARFMYETICIFGAFDSLITDQGREFINFALDILTDRFNINHRISSAYHPETNGQRERDNRTLKDTLVKITDNDDWDELLPAALFAYRTSVHKSTQFSPFLALYGEQAKLPFDVTGDANEQDLNEEIMDTMKGIHEEVKNKIGENISRAQKKQKEYYDSRRAYDHGFRIGDKVLIINAARVHRMGGKMAPRFVGPYEADNLGG